MPNNMDKPLIFLQDQKVLTIASSESEDLWIANVYFSTNQKGKIFFVSSENAKHSKMILQNPRVVFSVAWFDPDNLKKRKGIQGVGMCRVMTDEWEISEALDFHHKKFTEFKDEITAEWIKNNEWDSRAWATLLLNISKPVLDSRLVLYAAENGFIEKNEIHLTILSFQNGKKILKGINPNEKETVLGTIRSFAEKFQWNIKFIPGYFILERTIQEFILNGKVQTPTHTRRTVIQKVSAPDLSLFLGRLSENLSIDFDVPFPHMTLFSWSDCESLMTEGIGLNSESDFEKYKKQEIVL